MDQAGERLILWFKIYHKTSLESGRSHHKRSSAFIDWDDDDSSNDDDDDDDDEYDDYGPLKLPAVRGYHGDTSN